MTAIENISIPQPCHQSWQQMENKDNGRHCMHCSKTVIDFTKMTNDEIIGYLSMTNNVCGRFVPIQLETINKALYKPDLPSPSLWRNWLMAMGLFATTVFIRANAQTTPTNAPPIEQNAVSGSSIKEPMIGKVALNNDPKHRTISGKILDENNRPVSGAMISVYNTGTNVSTDDNGAFAINVPVSASKLLVGAVGFAGKEIIIGPNSSVTCQIKRQAPLRVMGGLAVTRTPFLKSLCYKVVKKRPGKQ